MAAAGIAIALFLALQFFLLLGPHPFDPAKYFSTAVHFPNVGADLWTLRIGLVAPVVVAIRLMGSNEAALYAVPLATGVLLVTAVYGTMLALFRDRILAVAAALVAALNTDFLLNSSFLFPDTAATATFATGFLFLVLGGLTARASNPWVPRGAVLAAGFFFGWTYLIRDFSPILTPTVVAAAASAAVTLTAGAHQPRREAAGACVGAGTALSSSLRSQMSPSAMRGSVTSQIGVSTSTRASVAIPP